MYWSFVLSHYECFSVFYCYTMNNFWNNDTDTQIMNFGTRCLIGLKLWPLYAGLLVPGKSYRASLDLLQKKKDLSVLEVKQILSPEVSNMLAPSCMRLSLLSHSACRMWSSTVSYMLLTWQRLMFRSYGGPTHRNVTSHHYSPRRTPLPSPTADPAPEALLTRSQFPTLSRQFIATIGTFEATRFFLTWRINDVFWCSEVCDPWVVMLVVHHEGYNKQVQFKTDT